MTTAHPDAPCPVHAEAAAMAPCLRCGTFTCPRCFLDEKARSRGICVRCLVRQHGSAEERSGKLRRTLGRVYGLAALVPLALGGMSLFFLTDAAMHITGGPPKGLMPMGSLAIAVTLAGCAVRIRRQDDAPRVAWIATGSLGLMIIGLVLLGVGLDCVFTLGLLPLFAGHGAWRLSRLREEAKLEAEALAALGR